MKKLFDVKIIFWVEIQRIYFNDLFAGDFLIKDATKKNN